MAETNPLEDLRKSREEEFFRKREKELLEKLQKRQAEEAERSRLAAAVGTPDAEVLSLLAELGFSAETVSVLHLVPLLEVAWADGSVSTAERRTILEAARLRGVAEGSPAHARLVEWLDRRPTGDLFERARAVVRAVVAAQPAAQREATTRDLLAYSTAVAEASGGLLGLGRKVSDEEAALLEKLTAALSDAHGEAARKVVSEG